MKPDDPNVQAWLEPELEARLVASLLGEASAFEQAELDRLLKERPEIAVFQRRLQAVHGLVGEAVKQGPDDEWKLSKDKRTKVLGTIRGTSIQSEKPSNVVAQKRTKRRWIGIATAAAVVVFAGAVATTSMMSGINTARSADIAMAREREEFGSGMDSKSGTVDFDVAANDGLESAPAASFGELAEVDYYAYQTPNTPSKPRELRSRNTGVTVSVDPAAGPDNYTIDLEIDPEVVEFEGLVNYESPVATTAPKLAADNLAMLGDLESPAEAGGLAYHDPKEETLGEAGQTLERLDREHKELAQPESATKLFAMVDENWETPIPPSAPSPAPVDNYFARSTSDTKSSFGASNAPKGVKDLSELASAATSESISEEAPARKSDLGRQNKLAETNKKGLDASGSTRFGLPVDEVVDVVTRSGREAKVEVIREMIVPEEVDEPEVAQAGEARATSPAAPSESSEMDWGYKTNDSLGATEGELSKAVANAKIDLPSLDVTRDDSVRHELSDTLADVSPGQVSDQWGTSEEPAQSPNSLVTADLSGYSQNLKETPARGEVAKASKDFQTNEEWSEPNASLFDGDNGTSQVAGINLIQREQLAKQSAADDPFSDNLGSKEIAEEEVRLAQLDTLERYRNVDFGAIQKQEAQAGEAGADVEFTDLNDPIALGIELQQSQPTAGQQIGAAVSRRTDQQWHSSGGAQIDLNDQSSESLWDDNEEIESSVLSLAGQITDPQFQEAMRGFRSGDQSIEVQEIEAQLATTKEKFLEILNSDSYNAAARNGLEELELRKSPSLATAYDQTRASLLKESPAEQQLAEQSDKVEEARLRMLDLAERYRIVDLAAIRNQASEIGDTVTEEENVTEQAKAKKHYETEKRNLWRLEEEQLTEALIEEATETREIILQQQLDKLATQKAQVAMLGERYDIPKAIERQNGAARRQSLSATESESKKDTSMDDQRKLKEYKEAEQELVFRRKLVEKVRRALEPTKSRAINEKHAKQEPFSTFSLHVSDVAFKLAKAALLEQNKWPEVEKVRVEEFVNAFDYGDPAPTQAEKVACQIEQAAHPFRQQRNLLRVSMRTAEMGRSSGTPLQITLLLDTSGSMERADRQESISRAMEVLTSQLTPNDTVTLIGFARQPRLIQDRLTGEALRNLPKFVKQTPSEGGTNLEEALLLGAEHARRQFVEAGQNRIVLLTDGAANLGDANAESLRNLVVGLRQEGIAFDACGVGAKGLNDAVLEALTRDGDGRYYLLNKPEDADAGFARQLAGAFRPAARNVKVQVRFNDRRVGNYRLLGFEKHRLKKEDFRNDKVDAAEMASSEAGVAVYEIEPLAQGKGEIGEVSVRFHDMATGHMVERSWTIAYNANVPALEEATPSLQLASTAAFLGEKLKKSSFGQTINLEELSQIQTNLRQHYSSDQRVASLIAMIEKAKEQ